MMNQKNKKRLMTDVAKGKFTMDEAEAIIESKEEIAPINSKKGKEQRDKARERLSKKAEEEKTQTRKLNPKGGKK